MHIYAFTDRQTSWLPHIDISTEREGNWKRFVVYAFKLTSSCALSKRISLNLIFVFVLCLQFLLPDNEYLWSVESFYSEYDQWKVVIHLLRIKTSSGTDCRFWRGFCGTKTYQKSFFSLIKTYTDLDHSVLYNPLWSLVFDLLFLLPSLIY